MEDATGQPIHGFDLLMFKTACAHGDRGVALEPLPGGTTLAALCMDGAKVAVKACDVTVVDRSFFHPGYPVTSASDPDGQSGIVMGCATEMDLQQLVLVSGEKKTRAGASPSQLRRVGSKLAPGDYVVFRGQEWLGRVVEVSLDGGCAVAGRDKAARRAVGVAATLRGVEPARTRPGAMRRPQHPSRRRRIPFRHRPKPRPQTRT